MGGRDFIGQHAHLASQIFQDDFEQPAYQGGSLQGELDIYAIIATPAA